MSPSIEYQKEIESLQSQLSEANKRISSLTTEDELTKKKLKDLNSSETRLKTLFESTSDAVMLLDEDGFTDCNSATLKLFGCATKEEFCSKHPADLSPPKQPCGTDSMTLADKRIATAMKNGSNQFEWIHKRLNGEKSFFAEVRLNKMFLDDKYILQASVRDISERKQLEIDALHRSEEAFEGTFNQAAVGIAHVGVDGTWLRVNKKLIDILGYTEDELKQLTFQDITHPDDLSADLKLMNQVLEGTIQTYSIEKRYIQKSGDFVCANLTVSLLHKADGTPDYFISVVQDISKRKKVEIELSESEAKWRSFAENSPDYIMMIDKKGIIQYVNHTVPDLTPEQIIGTPLTNYLVDKFIPIANTCFERVLNTGIPDSYETEFYSEDGSTIYFESSVGPVKNNGEIVALIISARDITERKQKDKQHKLHMRQAQMGEMISMIAHQWRQPLGAIAAASIDLKMQMELETFDLKEEKGRNNCEAYFYNRLKEIDELVQSLTTTIDDFRNFYKPNKAIVTLKTEEAVDKALTIIEASLINNNIEIIKEYNSKEDIKLHSNEIIQVILNILKNAQDNFKEKQIKNPRITIKTQNRTILICDNGGGVPENIIDKIFDPYYSTKDEKNGTGLGLYMSKTIIEEHHNGKLTAKNIDDGVCFTIEFGVIN